MAWLSVGLSQLSPKLSVNVAKDAWGSGSVVVDRRSISKVITTRRLAATAANVHACRRPRGADRRGKTRVSSSPRPLTRQPDNRWLCRQKPTKSRRLVSSAAITQFDDLPGMTAQTTKAVTQRNGQAGRILRIPPRPLGFERIEHRIAQQDRASPLLAKQVQGQVPAGATRPGRKVPLVGDPIGLAHGHHGHFLQHFAQQVILPHDLPGVRGEFLVLADKQPS
jgi:hypothetical protein